MFDPQSFAGLSLNWSSCLILSALIPISYWSTHSQAKEAFKSTIQSIKTEFDSIVGKAAIPAMIWLNVGAFFFIWVNNFMGLAPYVFTATSHLTLTLSLAMPLWLGHVILAWLKTPNHMFSHLVPLGSPMALAPFMVLIELVSAVIRPITLSVRLAANMVAGHLLMVLLSSPVVSSTAMIGAFILSALVLLATLESAVATIQAYVFSILTTLYVNEVNSEEMV